MVTPNDGEDHVDEASLRKILRYLLSSGIHGLVVLGSAGELPAISEDERKRAIEIAVDEVRGKVPVIAGAGNPDIRRAIQDVKTAKELGADAVLVVPPYYYNLSQQGLIYYFKEVAQMGIPIMLYNIPNFTKVRIEPSTVKILSQVEGIIGIKDSSRDFEYLTKLIFMCKETPNFRIFLGTDALLLAGLTLGVDGVISITPQVMPSWDLELLNCFQAGDLPLARKTQGMIVKLLEVLRIGNFPVGLKATVALLGLCSPNMWKPAMELTVKETEEIEGRLTELGIL